MPDKNKAQRYYQLVVSGDVAEVYIFGDIVSYPWEEYGDVSGYTLARELAGLTASEIRIYINSYGGEVSEGLAIYNELRRRGSAVTTICEGFAASAASVVFMAGERRIMRPASLLFVHPAWSRATGNAEELRKAAEDLDTITSASVAAYMSRVKITEEELRALMDAESWITPADALRDGFATAVEEGGGSATTQQSARSIVYNTIVGRGLDELAGRAQPEPSWARELRGAVGGLTSDMRSLLASLAEGVDGAGAKDPEGAGDAEGAKKRGGADDTPQEEHKLIKFLSALTGGKEGK